MTMLESWQHWLHEEAGEMKRQLESQGFVAQLFLLLWLLLLLRVILWPALLFLLHTMQFMLRHGLHLPQCSSEHS